KLDVAGSTPVARSREFEELACCRQEPDGGGGSLVTLCSRGFTRQGHRTPPALGLHPPRQNGSDTDAAASTRQPTVAGLPRSGRDAAGRRRPPTAWPDAVAAWRGSPADTAAARRAAGTGSRVAAAARPASPRPWGLRPWTHRRRGQRGAGAAARSGRARRAA